MRCHVREKDAIEPTCGSQIAELQGAAAGLAALPEPAKDPRLADYQPYWATRAELLARSCAHDEASQAYEIAIGLERDSAVRRFLQRRQAGLASGEVSLRRWVRDS